MAEHETSTPANVRRTHRKAICRGFGRGSLAFDATGAITIGSLVTRIFRSPGSATAARCRVVVWQTVLVLSLGSETEVRGEAPFAEILESSRFEFTGKTTSCKA